MITHDFVFLPLKNHYLFNLVAFFGVTLISSSSLLLLYAATRVLIVGLRFHFLKQSAFSTVLADWSWTRLFICCCYTLRCLLGRSFPILGNFSCQRCVSVSKYRIIDGPHKRRLWTVAWIWLFLPIYTRTSQISAG